MSVKYVIVEKGIRKAGTSEKKIHKYQCTGEISLKSLGKEIKQRNTVNHTDILAMLDALTQVLTTQLNEGENRSFQKFRGIQIGLGSIGAETNKGYSTSLIKSKMIWN